MAGFTLARGACFNQESRKTGRNGAARPALRPPRLRDVISNSVSILQYVAGFTPGRGGEVGRSRPGKPPLSGESDPVAESCGAGKGGQALGRRRRRKGLRPSSRGGRARRAAAEYPPGYDGLPGGAQGLRAWGRCFASGLPQVSPFPQAVSACGRGRRGGLRALASITIRIMMTIRTLLGSTKLTT